MSGRKLMAPCTYVPAPYRIRIQPQRGAAPFKRARSLLSRFVMKPCQRPVTKRASQTHVIQRTLENRRNQGPDRHHRLCARGNRAVWYSPEPTTRAHLKPHPTRSSLDRCAWRVAAPPGSPVAEKVQRHLRRTAALPVRHHSLSSSSPYASQNSVGVLHVDDSTKKSLRRAAEAFQLGRQTRSHCSGEQ